MEHAQDDPDARHLRGLPRVPARAFHRPHLIALLDGEWDLAVVQGPAGSGKSVLLSQWVASQRRQDHGLSAPLRWVDAGDCDQFAAVADDLAHTAGIVIVDRADLLPVTTLHALGRALDANPNGARLVLAARSSRVLDRLVESSDGSLLVIDAGDLMVTEAEFAQEAPALSRHRRAAVISDTGGLIAGVRDAVDGAGKRAVRRFRARLLSELAQRPGDYGRALARLAVVREVDVRVARAIGVDPSWLVLAEEDGLGHHDAEWFVVSHFAADVLAPLLERTSAEERAAWAQDALSAGLSEARPVEALRLAIELGDLELASDVVLLHATFYLYDVRGAAVASAIIPAAGLHRHPILMIARAHAQVADPTTRANGMQLFAQAFVALRARSRTAGPEESAFLRLVTSVVMRLTPLADRALPMAKSAIDDLREAGWGGWEKYPDVVGYLLSRVGLVALYSGDFDYAEEMFERAYSEWQVAGRPERVDPLSLWAVTRALRGDLHGARSLIGQAGDLEWPPGWREGAQGQPFHLAQAVFALESGPGLEVEFWEHLLACGPVEDHLEHWVSFAVVLAWHDALIGEPVAGLARTRAIRRRRARMPTTSMASSWLDAAESLLAAMAGDLRAARELAERAARHSAEGAVALARISVAMGRDAEALAALAALEERPRAPVRVRAEAEVLAATLALRAGNPEGAWMLERAASRVRPTGMLLPFVGLSDADRSLVAEAAGSVQARDMARLIERGRPGRPLETVRIPALTKREIAVLTALHESPSLTEAAARLYVSRNTVKTQVRSLYRKLGVSSREEAIHRSIMLGLTAHGSDTGPGVQ